MEGIHASKTGESRENVMLSVRGLEVTYGYIHAVKGISFEVPKNSIVALVGSNGAGKTTTLSAISAVVKKSGGAVSFQGRDITAEKPHKIVGMGLCQVPEGRHVYPQLTVYENLLMGNIAARKMKNEQIAALVEEQYTLFPRLRERQRQMAGTLSGGEQQMLAIARALMSDPELLMLDEPSMGLAPIIIDEIFELLLTLKNRGKTILLIEQNASIALAVADYAYVLELGNITLSGTGMALLENDEVKRTYLG